VAGGRAWPSEGDHRRALATTPIADDEARGGASVSRFVFDRWSLPLRPIRAALLAARRLCLAVSLAGAAPDRTRRAWPRDAEAGRTLKPTLRAVPR
jgi:hypothetical protein